MTNEELNRKISEAMARSMAPAERDWSGRDDANAVLLDELPFWRRQQAIYWTGEQRRRAVCDEWLEEKGIPHE